MYNGDSDGDGNSDGNVDDGGSREHWEDRTIDCIPKNSE